jgi:hypothetical protein
VQSDTCSVVLDRGRGGDSLWRIISFGELNDVAWIDDLRGHVGGRGGRSEQGYGQKER